MGDRHSPAIALERVQPMRPGTFDVTDTATRRTVQKMCELIRKSCTDPYVQQCAEYARQHFAMGSNDPGALAWGVFWYVKHSVKFRLDEGTMFQIGERNEQDLLIAPEVLVRMKDPAEDCDGFTMLTAALLTCLGVPVLIATVATEAEDPSRWSHVFLCAIVNGRVMPLDTSHGPAPGWMVPKHRIHRWQTWKLDGTPADVKIPSYQGLHGYAPAGRRGGLGQVRVGGRVVMMPRIQIVRRGRGFGQDDSTQVDDLTGDTSTDWFESDFGPSDTTIATNLGTSQSLAASFGMCVDQATGLSTDCPTGTATGSPVSSACPTGYVLNGWACQAAPGVASGCGGTGQPACSSSGSSSSSIPVNYTALASQLLATAGADAKVALQQPANLLNAQTWANLTAYLPIIGIAVLGVVVLTSFAGKK